MPELQGTSKLTSTSNFILRYLKKKTINKKTIINKFQHSAIKRQRKKQTPQLEPIALPQSQRNPAGTDTAYYCPRSVCQVAPKYLQDA